MTDGTLLLRSTDVLTRSFAEEVLVASPEGGDVDRLPATAAALWDLLEEPRALGDVVSIMARAYSVPEEVVAGDVEPLVRELVERGWVVEIRDADD